ncbi:MAG TPA: L,D-transpeptidase family protein [Clostridia bacterium]|nr:L,D-transpeptidase family protein [Clostridia bacterium]
MRINNKISRVLLAFCLFALVYTYPAPAWSSTPVTKPPKGEVTIVIDAINRKLTVFSDGEPHKQYPCAVGTNDTPTPVGNWAIKRKSSNWGTGFGTRWLGLNVPWGIFGIHGTNKPGSIGTFASHGCIRMFNTHVEEIYPWVSLDTPVIIIGNPFGNPGCTHRILRNGEKGSDVMEIQRNLRRLGYYDGETDGIFGGGTEKAVIQFRKDNNLRHDNCIDEDCYKLLGL